MKPGEHTCVVQCAVCSERCAVYKVKDSVQCVLCAECQCAGWYTGQPYEAESRHSYEERTVFESTPTPPTHTHPSPPPSLSPSPPFPSCTTAAIRPFLPSNISRTPIWGSEGGGGQHHIHATPHIQHANSTSTTPHNPLQTNESPSSLPSLLTWRSALFGFATFATISPSS